MKTNFLNDSNFKFRFWRYLSENPIELKDDRDLTIFLRDGSRIKDETIVNRLALMETSMDQAIPLGVSNRLVLYLKNADEGLFTILVYFDTWNIKLEFKIEQSTLIELLMETMLFGVVNCESTPELYDW